MKDTKGYLQKATRRRNISGKPAGNTNPRILDDVLVGEEEHINN
jgi:hypothetical protein